MFRPTALMLTSLAIAALFQTASCQTPEEDDPPITLNPVPHSLSNPSRRWDLEGRGDGAEHDFIYTTWANPGTFEISVRAQAQRWMSSTTVTLEDASGKALLSVRARGGTEAAASQEGVYRLLGRQSVRLHVHVDENVGPYSISISGPIDRQ
ncbi:MAG: hypothetical protein U0931_02035 [Vulcanimicrobiota bacterium]